MATTTRSVIEGLLRNGRLIFPYALMIGTFMLVWKATEWAFGFAEISTLDGTGRAAVIVAAVGPVTALLGYVFKYFAETEVKRAENVPPAPSYSDPELGR